MPARGATRGCVKLITQGGTIPRAVWIPASMISSRTEEGLISHGEGIDLEVRSEAARFDVVVRAKSIQRAMSIMQEHYWKGSLEVKSRSSPRAVS
jgi:hypothetical protein